MRLSPPGEPGQRRQLRHRHADLAGTAIAEKRPGGGVVVGGLDLGRQSVLAVPMECLGTCGGKWVKHTGYLAWPTWQVKLDDLDGGPGLQVWLLCSGLPTRGLPFNHRTWRWHHLLSRRPPTKVCVPSEPTQGRSERLSCDVSVSLGE